MPFNLGPGELIFLAAAALLLFGPQKLPEIGRALGEALGSLKKAYNSAVNLEDVKSNSPQIANQTNFAQPQTKPVSLPSASELPTSSKAIDPDFQLHSETRSENK